MGDDGAAGCGGHTCLGSDALTDLVSSAADGRDDAAGPPPAVTIVTPTYNRADLLPATIESILGQSFTNFEHIIIDDGSSDGTGALVRQYDDPRIRYYWHENRGEAASTNRGWALARGRYAAVVSSDDPVLPNWLEHSVAFMDARPDIVVGYPRWQIIDHDSNVLTEPPTFEYSLEGMVSWLYTIPGPGSLIRRSALDSIRELRNPTYGFVSDLESWLRIGLHGPFARIPEILATWRTHPTSITVADRSLRRSREMIRLAREFFARDDLPAEIRALRRYAFSRAYWIAAWVVVDTHPLRSALYLRKSYALAPDDPPNLPTPLRRFPRPDTATVARTAATGVRKRILGA